MALYNERTRFEPRDMKPANKAQAVHFGRLKSEFRQTRAQHLAGSINFWEMHAAYWGERGRFANQATCQERADEAKRELRGL